MMEAPLDGDAGGLAPFTRLVLDLRGVRFVIDRETVVNLPESILLCPVSYTHLTLPTKRIV